MVTATTDYANSVTIAKGPSRMGTDLDLMTMPEVAELTRLPIATLRWYRHTGTGPRSFKLSKRVMYRRADVVAWIERQYATTGGGAA
jgi:predicted DNA-binding transcriptional regulator AlpA